MTDTFREAYVRYLRLASWATVSGMAVGVLILGIGSRLAMRLLAATSDDDVQGAFTDAGEAIGDITLGGTIGLLIFAGMFFGAAGGWLYALIRPALPAATASRRWACAGIGAIVGAASLVNPDGRDFSLLRPTWLAVLGFTILPACFGVGVSVVADRLRSGYEVPPTRWGWARYAPMLGLLPFFPVLVVLLIAGVAWAAGRGRAVPAAWFAMRAVIVLAVAGLGAFSVVRVADIETREPVPRDFVDPFDDD